MYQGRPVAQSTNHEGIYVVTRADLAAYKVAKEEFTKFGEDLPIRVYLDLPEDRSEISRIVFVTEFTDRKPLALRTDLYQLFLQPEPAAIERLLSRQQREADPRCALVPLLSERHSATVCLNHLAYRG